MLMFIEKMLREKEKCFIIPLFWLVFLTLSVVCCINVIWCQTDVCLWRVACLSVLKRKSLPQLVIINIVIQILGWINLLITESAYSQVSDKPKLYLWMYLISNFLLVQNPEVEIWVNAENVRKPANIHNSGQMLPFHPCWWLIPCSLSNTLIDGFSSNSFQPYDPAFVSSPAGRWQIISIIPS